LGNTTNDFIGPILSLVNVKSNDQLLGFHILQPPKEPPDAKLPPGNNAEVITP
jgi:hypothetical protein